MANVSAAGSSCSVYAVVETPERHNPFTAAASTEGESASDPAGVSNPMFGMQRLSSAGDDVLTAFDDKRPPQVSLSLKLNA